MSFTLFIILPNGDVCSLRHLASGTSIKTVRKNLELSAGLPAQTYRLTCPEGQVLHEDHVLRMDVNVWDGYVIKAVFLDSWQELYDHIVANDVDHVIKHGAVYMRGDVVWMDLEEEGRAREVMKERGVVALYVASFLAMQEMCKALLSVDINPNGKTPFGRTPLFAAMSRDNDHVMELLLAHNALLEARDVDGVTAVDVARRATATQCVRKVRHLHLQSKGESTSSSSGSSDPVKKKGPRAIRVPSGTVVSRDSSFRSRESSFPSRESSFPSRESSFPSSSNGRQRISLDESPDRSTVLSSGSELYPGAGEQTEGKPSPQKPQQLPKHSRLPRPRALFRQDKESELYAWDNNLTHASRTPSATGTQARLSLGSSSGGQPSRRGNRGVKGAGISWCDTTSVSSTAPRLLPFRPTVQEISIKGPSSVLTTSSTTSVPVPSTVTFCSLDPEDRSLKPRRPSVLVRFYAQSPHSRASSPSTHRSQRPHAPAQEPSGRPPTRADSVLMLGEPGDEHTGGSGGTNSVLGSQETLSVGSAPELTTTGGGNNPQVRGILAEADHGDSDDDGGRVLTSRGKGFHSSGRFRTRMLVSRQKQQESWKTMKRRIKLAEEQKRNTVAKPHQNTKSETGAKESFEQWLERKRREHHITDKDTSEDDEELMNRTAENSQAFSDWFKDLNKRPLRPQMSSPASLHRRKSRPSKNLIEIGNQKIGDGEGGNAHTEADGYLTAYRQWQHRKKLRETTGAQGSIQDIEEAKRQVEEKRKSLLAMALTFQDWVDHTEQRKKLMQAILQADVDKLAAIEQQLFHTQRTPRHTSFSEWREKVDKREAEIRNQRYRMRKEAELRQRNGVVGDEFMRNGAAIDHEHWVHQKKETATRERNKTKRSVDADMKGHDSVVMSEDEKEKALDEWLEQKHKHEVAQLNQHLRQERRLLLSVRQKKPPTVTPC